MKIDKARMAAKLDREEDTVLHAYKDHLGYLTIGTGRCIDERKGGGITKEEAAYLLNNDIERRWAALVQALPWVDTLDGVRQAALLEMAFQLGLDGLLKFKQTLAAVRDGRYDHAETLALQSLWAKQTPARAKRVARQLASGEWQ